MNRIVGFIGFLLVLMGCQNEINQQICDYELHHHKISIEKLVHVGNFSPFYALDSAKLIKPVYDSLYNEKIASIQWQLNELQNQWIIANQEFCTIKNPLMIAPYQKQLGLLKNRVVRLEKILETYTNHPEQTGFQTYQLQMKIYNQNPDSLLGYTLKVNFIGVEGLMPKTSFARTYYFNSTKTRIELVSELDLVSP